MNKLSNTEATALVGTSFIGIVVMLILAVLVRGYCLSVLWGWLIVPVFGLPALSIAAALGLTVFLSLLLNNTKKDGTFSDVFVNPLVALGLGYIVKLFI